MKLSDVEDYYTKTVKHYLSKGCLSVTTTRMEKYEVSKVDIRMKSDRKEVVRISAKVSVEELKINNDTQYVGLYIIEAKRFNTTGSLFEPLYSKKGKLLSSHSFYEIGTDSFTDDIDEYIKLATLADKQQKKVSAKATRKTERWKLN